MTKEDIIEAAFKVWGRDLYRTTSLTQIAGELGVSKPALYRHFKDKDSLLDAMYSAYFDDFAEFNKKGFDKAVNAPSRKEADLIIVRTFAEYYIRNRDAFIFSLIQVYNSRIRKNTIQEMALRGFNFDLLAREKDPFYPPQMQLIMATVVFSIAEFHQRSVRTGEIHQRSVIKAAPRAAADVTNETVERVLSGIEARICKGLRLDGKTIAALDYEALEKRAAGTVWDSNEVNALLRAVAEAVAEAGPWDASMEMVAKRSGLSKSGLYAHFKSRLDMLSQMFVTEFTRMANLAKAQIESSTVPEEQLYLGIMSIAGYLRSRPEILVALDWIKTRRFEGLGKEIPGHLFRIIGSIKLEAIQSYDKNMLVEIAQWIIFMTINNLVWWPSGRKSCPAMEPEQPDMSINWAKSIIEEVPNESFRILFRFIALGLEGIDQ